MIGDERGGYLRETFARTLHEVGQTQSLSTKKLVEAAASLPDADVPSFAADNAAITWYGKS